MVMVHRCVRCLVWPYLGFTSSTGTPRSAATSSIVRLPSEMMPTPRAMALAVMGWSPVTMITWNSPQCVCHRWCSSPHSLSPSISLSLSCLSVSVCLSVCLSVSVSLCLSWNIYLCFPPGHLPPPLKFNVCIYDCGCIDVLWFWLGVYNASSLSFQSW